MVNCNSQFYQPRTKYFAMSRAVDTASASPLIGAYRDSAKCINLLFTSVIFQAVLQQNGSCFGQVCNSQNPMPVLDQSVARQAMIADFDS